MYGGTPIAPPIHLNFFLIAPIPPHHLQSKNLRSNVTTSKVLPTPGSKYPAKKGHDTNAHRLQFRELRPSIPRNHHVRRQQHHTPRRELPRRHLRLLPPKQAAPSYPQLQSAHPHPEPGANHPTSPPCAANTRRAARDAGGDGPRDSRGDFSRSRGRGGGVAKKPGARSAGPSTAAPEEGRRIEARARVRAQVRKIYEDAVKALDVQAVFAGSGGPTGDAAITGWEEKVAVPRWEENMEALEFKEAAGKGQGDEGTGDRS
ncbi:essential protein Yae1 [Penicillium chermesinum]|uniref:Essential protein Yae1 n=1 Tax=Penicillium chermesinum TaxID=63820 RepID=A0A9W9TG24_9EURO|nr:essential protein Yae1 [Penicillium chermesinum]KAJ5220145.1 essential protein Yae1 [Penicillium chermesinum]